MTPETPGPRAKPLLRGVSHEVAAAFAIVAWLVLARTAGSHVARVAAHVYGASLFILFATSAFYHRPNWPPRVRRWLGQMDLAAIFILVAGTYTPFCLLLDHTHSTRMLIFAWGSALLGILQATIWTRTPKAVAAIIYVVLGWGLVLIMPAIDAALGGRAVLLLVAGGVIYSLGAAVYAIRRPDPFPRVFGYHEIFHVMVIAAAALQFVAAMQAVRLLG